MSATSSVSSDAIGTGTDREKTMKAIVQDGYGPAEGLRLTDIDKPEFKDDEVLIRVHAAGVNVADWAVMSGLPYIARPVYGMGKPKNPVRGTDVAGTVEAVGTGVTRFKAGDEIFGSAEGSFAEFARASEDRLASKPVNLDFEKAAAAPLAGLVALQSVRDHGDVQAGQKVLIIGASGGIGTFAVQMAKSLGAEVTGVCSTRNVEMVRSIGAHHVIDYTTEDVSKVDERYDFILDNVANLSFADLRRLLTPQGTLVPNGGGFDNLWFASGGRVVKSHVLKRFVGHNLRPFLVSQRSEDLAPLKGLIEEGKVTPVIDHVYPLNEASQAMTHVGEGHTRGKVVITI